MNQKKPIDQGCNYLQSDEKSTLLARRIAILLHLLKHGESSIKDMQNAYVVEMGGIAFTRLLKQLVMDGFVTVRGEPRKEHFYQINAVLADTIDLCCEANKVRYQGASAT